MSKETRVLYNADCPVCSFEIDRYAAYSKARSLPIRFDDLNGQALAQWGIDAETAARRLHVLHEGTVHSGIDGFIVLWRQMPRTLWLARIVALPGVHWMAAFVYDRILAPLIYSRHLRRQSLRA